MYARGRTTEDIGGFLLALIRYIIHCHDWMRDYLARYVVVFVVPGMGNVSRGSDGSKARSRMATYAQDRRKPSATDT